MRNLLSLVVLLFAALVQATSSTGSRLLVILDDTTEKSSYSQFLGDLSERGFQISYESPKSESLSLFHLGERSYDHVLFLPVKTKGLGPNLTPSLLLQFISANGNILLALSSETTVPSSLVSLFSELDISIPDDRTGLVVDHFNYDASSAAEKHDVLLLQPPAPLRPGMVSYFHPGVDNPEPIAFPRGIGHILGSGPLLTPVLRAPSTAYLYNPKEQSDTVDPSELFGAGEQLSLVSAMQARNSARFAIVGSAEMLTDKWFDAKVKGLSGKTSKTWNREFAKRVAGWVFHEIGVLRVNWIEHSLNPPANETNPKMYRVKNDVVYTISLSEYSWDKWNAFLVPNGDDLQLEFSMLSPFHRLNLNRAKITGQECTYSVAFTLPDQHGIFNFKVNYKRPFLTNVEEKNTVSVRHIAHDEWPRSFVISGAWPWIAGIFTTVTGFVAFCGLWMYSKPVGVVSDEKKKK